MSGKDERPETSYEPIWVPEKTKRVIDKLVLCGMIIMGLCVFINIQVENFLAAIMLSMSICTWSFIVIEKETIEGYWKRGFNDVGKR